MPVVLNGGFGGVIFHEACGHSLEATSVAKGNSVFAGKLGEKIASDVVTAIDDGTIPGEWGSINIDDEGFPGRKNILIENGILKGYMVDRLNGRRMGHEPTGNSRRQSYKYAPTSRMTNTYIASGRATLEEIIASLPNGLFARKMGGGSVNPVTGEFNFAVSEGYLIKNGKIDTPVRGATLIGKGSDVLLRIDMVGDTVELGQGVCGSASGGVPVNVGQPVIRVSEMTVGGR
jgi:TldD protein